MEFSRCNREKLLFGLAESLPYAEVEMEQVFSTKTGQAWGVLNEAQATALIGNVESMQYFWPFMPGPCTAAQAAREAGVRLDTMLYRIERFLALGLLKQLPGVARQRKQYQAVAERLIVPFGVTHFDSLVTLLLQHEGLERRMFARSLVQLMASNESGWMVRIHCDDSQERKSRTIDAAPLGQLDWKMSEMLALNAPAVWYTMQILNLTRPQAKALQNELLMLWTKYDSLSKKSLESTTKYYLQMSLAPVDTGNT